MQAIILAGGFGSRLQAVVKEVPKPLAPISGKPFLFWLITHLKKNGVTSFIFSLGYLHHQIEDFLKEEFPNLNYDCVVEKEPLGTGGAIKLCMQKVTSKDALIINGDSFFNLNIKAFFQFYQSTNSSCSIALTEMHNFDRYGSVTIDKQNIIHQFNEKKYCEKGLINTGILIFNKDVFEKKTEHFPPNFSYEKDFLEPNISQIKVTGYIAAGYFIDIGIPEDYYKANRELEGIVSGY
ncbi:MAG: nucleotidyltransferase family protein [Chitinophagaceae bacterium]